MITFDMQRQNAITNPRAHVDTAGWSAVIRVTAAPVTFPAGADTAFLVAPYTGGRLACGDWLALPAGVGSGDWVYVQFDAFVNPATADPGACALSADLDFRNGLGQIQGSRSFCRYVHIPHEAFVHYSGVLQVPGNGATEFAFFTKVVPILEHGADTAVLYFTNVSVERVFARNLSIPAFADGDSDGWEWLGTAHNSASQELVAQRITMPDLDETIVTPASDGTYTFPSVDHGYVLEVQFGPAVCTVTVNVGGGAGTVDPIYKEVASGGSLEIVATPADGYVFDHATVNGDPGSLSLTNIIDHTVVMVYFKVTTFTLTYTAGDHGSITGDAEQEVEYGSSGTVVRAVPDAGYHFVEWSDHATSAVRIDFGVHNDISVTASFAIDVVEEYHLTYTAGANGSLTGDSSQTVLRGGNGTEVVAVADSGYAFTGWSDGVPQAARTDIGVTKDITVTANFVSLVTWTLTYTAGPGGTITGSASQTVVNGENGALVVATPNAGYVFSGWSDGRSVAPRQELHVHANLSVTAIFEVVPMYNLTYSAETGGTIVGDANQQVAAGEHGTMVVATPSAGYVFDSWSDGRNTASRLDVGVDKDLAVTASFVSAVLWVRYRGIGGGTISGDDYQTVTYGDDGTEVEAVPDAHHHFTIWNDGVTTAKRTERNVTKNIRVYARFAPDVHTLTYTAGSGGTLRGMTSQSVRYGRPGMPVTAIPNAGYHFLKWSDEVTAARRTDVNVTNDVTVSAIFEANP